MVSKPAAFKAMVNGSKLYNNGSPPVIMANLPGCTLAAATISSILNVGCFEASQLSFTSHHTQPTSHPANLIKNAARP